jgi:hypothetical protein
MEVNERASECAFMLKRFDNLTLVVGSSVTRELNKLIREEPVKLLWRFPHIGLEKALLQRPDAIG